MQNCKLCDHTGTLPSKNESSVNYSLNANGMRLLLFRPPASFPFSSCSKVLRATLHILHECSHYKKWRPGSSSCQCLLFQSLLADSSESFAFPNLYPTLPAACQHSGSGLLPLSPPQHLAIAFSANMLTAINCRLQRPLTSPDSVLLAGSNSQSSKKKLRNLPDACKIA